MTVGPMFSERVSQLMRPSSSAMDSMVKPWGTTRDVAKATLLISICGSRFAEVSSEIFASSSGSNEISIRTTRGCRISSEQTRPGRRSFEKLNCRRCQ